MTRMCRMEQLEPRQLLAVNVIEPMGQVRSLEDAHDGIVDLRGVRHRSRSGLELPRGGQLEPRRRGGDGRTGGAARHKPDQYGQADITVRAAGPSDASEATDTVRWIVQAVNDIPTLVRGFPEITVPEGGRLTLDLTEHFADVEQPAAQLTYHVTPLQTSSPGDPVQSALVNQGILTIQLTDDIFGYAHYTVRAVDLDGGSVSTTLFLYVDPVNDRPTARTMPDRYHRTLEGSAAMPVAVDLWDQYVYDQAWEPYFRDVEDGTCLDYSVAVDRPDVFAVTPYVDRHGFLLYQPTNTPQFHGSAVVTITARDREGLVAVRPDGSRPSFTVHVDNRSAMLGGWSSSVASDPFATPSHAEPGREPAEVPDPFFNLVVLGPRSPRELQHEPGIFVAINDDSDERNVGEETIRVGPHDRPVAVLRPAKDNEPNRITQQGRGHRIVLPWQRPWNTWSDQSEPFTLDDDVRRAVVEASVAGTVRFEVPDEVKLWVPAWALHGIAPFTHNSTFWQQGMRWIEVGAGEMYRVEEANAFGTLVGGGIALPVAIEGMVAGSGQVIATFTPAGTSHTLTDSATFHVVAVDLDVDSDNDQERQPPRRSAEEDRLEEDPSHPGKRVLVNARDVDRDGIPDFLDGFDLDGHVHTATGPRGDDDRVTATDGVGFVPLIVDLPAPIDPGRALIQFSYVASDPAAATIGADGARRPATGGVRLWTVDESHPRSPRAPDDPVRPGHYVAPYAPMTGGGTHPYSPRGTYTVAQLTGGMPVRQFTLFVEGVCTGQYTVNVAVDPDGSPASVLDADGNTAPSIPTCSPASPCATASACWWRAR